MLDDTETMLAGNARQLETLDRLSRSFGQSLAGALSAGATSGKQLGSVLDGIGAKLAGALGRSAVSTLQTTLTGALQGAARALTEAASSFSFGGNLFPFARGGALSGGLVVPFASGGVVASPSYFPLGRGLGLMGEAGAEAVMPLARGPDGRLGVRAGPAAAASVTVNIATPDIDSFRRSEAQVSAALARAVARGRRAS
ncbi:phage tail tape measure protein [Enterovirga aerilata]|uniref:Phage tail tape measure protein n=1 Tax=Enterovirga aerilata TaxID=2730920 RepID=A0A849HYP1_9HYPH|nr:phage tail tape measure protein [Enterovirga sp. DB1703]NNM72646.1 phage tail tape measure protein [Enterovirga sp. DB1703]